MSCGSLNRGTMVIDSLDIILSRLVDMTKVSGVEKSYKYGGLSESGMSGIFSEEHSKMDLMAARPSLLRNDFRWLRWRPESAGWSRRGVESRLMLSTHSFFALVRGSQSLPEAERSQRSIRLELKSCHVTSKFVYPPSKGVGEQRIIWLVRWWSINVLRTLCSACIFRPTWFDSELHMYGKSDVLDQFTSCASLKYEPMHTPKWYKLIT